MTTTTTKTTLILGGTGKTGRRVAERMAAKGLPIRIGSRPRFDWNDEATWSQNLAGVGAVYVTYQPDLAIPGAAEHIERFVRAAVDAGVTRLVLLAGRGEPQVHRAEAAVRNSGLEWTVLECAFFNQNYSEGFLVAGPDGVIAFPAGDVAEPFVDCDDIADVAVAALSEPGHAGQTYDLTGPRLLTHAEVAAELSRASGRTFTYVPVSFEAYAEALAQFMSPPEVAFFIDLFRHLVGGHNAHLGDGVERALGRKARDFRVYAEAAFKPAS